MFKHFASVENEVKHFFQIDEKNVHLRNITNFLNCRALVDNKSIKYVSGYNYMFVKSYTFYIKNHYKLLESIEEKLMVDLNNKGTVLPTYRLVDGEEVYDTLDFRFNGNTIKIRPISQDSHYNIKVTVDISGEIDKIFNNPHLEDKFRKFYMYKLYDFFSVLC
ncbi:MAG: hypothetical protein ACRCTZ_23200 [Sarcina sp.]